MWPTFLQVRRPDGHPDLVLRPLRGRDRRAWEALRAANADWLLPWEAGSPEPGRTLRYSQMVRHLDRLGRDGLAQPFVVETGGRLVGQVHLTQIVWGSARTAQIGYWVDEAHAGRGIAPTAVAAVLDHAFLALALHRVYAYVRADNAASLRVVEKLGMAAEGVARGALFVDGAWRDHVQYALLASDVPAGGVLQRWQAASG